MNTAQHTTFYKLERMLVIRGSTEPNGVAFECPAAAAFPWPNYKLLPVRVTTATKLLLYRSYSIFSLVLFVLFFYYFCFLFIYFLGGFLSFTASQYFKSTVGKRVRRRHHFLKLCYFGMISSTSQLFRPRRKARMSGCRWEEEKKWALLRSLKRMIYT